MPKRPTTPLLLAGALLAAPLVFIGTGMAAGSSAAAAPPCPAMQVAGVRSSGETVADNAGYGPTVAAVVREVRRLVPSARAHAIDYPAVEVDGWRPAVYGADYRGSVLVGRAALTDYVRDFVAGPCGGSTYLFLVGFGQGAHVAANTYQLWLTPQERDRVGGMALLGDPRFNGAQPGGVDVGNFRPLLDGVYGLVGQPRTFPPARHDEVRSFCLRNDPVCNYSNPAASACTDRPRACAHLGYRRVALSGTTTYTDAAAHFLVRRWHQLTGETDEILLFGSFGGSGTASLQGALELTGHDVTPASELPTDLSGYDQVWWYGQNVLSEETKAALIDYASSGGGLYLTGDWASCFCGNIRAVLDVLDGLIQSSEIWLGPDVWEETPDVVSVNPTVIGDLAQTPNELTTLTGNAMGTLDGTRIPAEHFLFTDDGGNGVVTVWDENDVPGGGRVAVVMDINWVQPEHGDMDTMQAIVENLASFLAGAGGSAG